MQKISVWIKGVTPLLMNSNQGVNPMHPLTKELKKITSKRKKTDEDNEAILKLKWALGIYYDEATGPYVPAVNVEAMLREAAKKQKRGKDVISSLIVDPDMIPLIYDGPRGLEELRDDPNLRYSDVKIGRIRGASVTLNRPRFSNWQLKFNITYDERVFDLSEIEEFLHVGGVQIGICDYRPRYGKFEVVSADPA